MKTLMIAIAMVATMSFTSTSAKAQLTAGDVSVAANNLVSIQLTNVANGLTIQNIANNLAQNLTITDVIDVTNVLNNSNVNVLNDVSIGALQNILNGTNITLDNVLTNVLRDADIIKNNQVVVGILSNGDVLVAKQGLFRKL